MRLTRLGQTVVMLVILTAIVITAWMNNSENDKKNTAGDCTVMVSGEATDAQWNKAVKEGWKGHAGDGMEALWSPQCSEDEIENAISWNTDTASDKPSEEFTTPPVDENGEYITNPCPYEAQMNGYCEGGW